MSDRSVQCAIGTKNPEPTVYQLAHTMRNPTQNTVHRRKDISTHWEQFGDLNLGQNTANQITEFSHKTVCSLFPLPFSGTTQSSCVCLWTIPTSATILFQQ